MINFFIFYDPGLKAWLLGSGNKADELKETADADQ